METDVEKLTVLIVDDDALVIMAIEDQVVEAGFAFFSMGTGEGALAELEKDPDRFCAVLTDVRMPGEASGWDVGRRARELRSDMPVIYMTGDSASQWTAQGVPGSILLQKPFAHSQLTAALATLLNRSGIPPFA
ncbi:MAG: response regulator [Pseudorhizobium sp.]